MVDVRGHWVEVGWVRGSHSLCGGSLCCAISLRLRPPSTNGPPDVSPGLITWSTASSKGVGGGALEMVGWGGGRAASGEGGNGVTLTEPAVDKTLRQIRQSRVWSLFCFPLLLLSGGISLLLLWHSPFFLSTFLSEVTNLLNLSPPPALLSLSKQKYPCCYRGMCAMTVSGLRNLFSSGFLIVFLFSLTGFWHGEEPAFDWQQKNVFDIVEKFSHFFSQSSASSS